MDDSEPVFNMSSAPCGAVGNPHVVASPSSLRCGGCGADLAAILTERMVAARARAAGEGR